MAYKYKFNPEEQENQYTKRFNSYIKDAKESGGIPKERQWRVTEGEHVIRILPPYSERGIIAKRIPLYFGRGMSNLTFISPEFWGETCPFMRARRELQKIVGKDESLYKQYADDIALVRPRMTYFSNILVMSNQEEYEKGPQLFSYGKTVYEFIDKFSKNPKLGDIFDDEHGRNLSMTVEGEGIKRSYVLYPEDISPIENPEFLNEMFNLDECWVKPDLDDVEACFATLQFKLYKPSWLNMSYVQVPHTSTSEVSNPRPLVEHTENELDLEEQIKEFAPPAEKAPPVSSRHKIEDLEELERKLKEQVAG